MLKKQAAAPEADFEVKPIDDAFTGIEITKYKGKEQLVVIPATIQGLPVKRIGTEAFYENNNLVAVVIPEEVTFIGWRAFFKCTNLSTVVLPSTLKALYDQAFGICSSLKSIELPSGLLHIGERAFYSSGVTSINPTGGGLPPHVC